MVRLMAYMIGLVWMVTELSLGERERLLLMQAFVVGCFVLCGILIQAYLSGQVVEGYRYVPSYLNPNDAADIIAAGVAMALLIVGSHTGRLKLWLNVAFLPLAFLGVILTASRSGFFLTCLAAVGILFVIRRTRLAYRLAWLVVLLGVFSGVFFGLTGNQKLSLNLERLTFGSATYSLGTLTGRTTIWSAGVELFKEHPLVGEGAGTFATAVQSGLGQAAAAHDLFVEVAVESGIVGLILVIGVLAAAAMPILLWRDHQTGLRVLLLLVLIGTSLVANITSRYSLWLVLAILSTNAVVRRREVTSSVRARQSAAPGLRHDIGETRMRSI